MKTKPLSKQKIGQSHHQKKHKRKTAQPDRFSLDGTRPFKYHEKLFLRGALGGNRPRLLAINAYTNIDLHCAKFIVLKALFAQALKVAGEATPMDVPDVPFISAEQLLIAIHSYQDARLGVRIVFEDAEPQSVINVISLIRDELVQNGFPRDLIGNGRHGHGYRLEVPPKNLKWHWYPEPPLVPASPPAPSNGFNLQAYIPVPPKQTWARK